jgi:hypothetical protein
VGPAAGAVIGTWGYSSAFLFALICVMVALGITVLLHRRNPMDDVVGAVGQAG